jgi:hypothetical protein
MRVSDGTLTELQGKVVYVLKTYRLLLSLPHARAFVLAGFVARLSISMRALGSVLMVSELTGSYGLAGAVAAAALLGEAVAAPRLGRLVDRYGQRRVLLMSLAVHSAGTIALVLSAQLSAPTWMLFATAALSGAAALPVGSLVRARWSALVGSSPPLEAAFALESTLDELIFVLGPVLVTALALGVAPGAGLLGALVLTTVGSLALALQRRTEPAPAGVRDRSETPAIGTPGLRVLVATFVAAGVIFGTLDVAMVAFAGQVGSPAAAGTLLALIAAGSLLAGLGYGSRSWRWPLDKRFVASVVRYASARSRTHRRTHGSSRHLSRRGDSAHAHRGLHSGPEAGASRSPHGGTQLDDHGAGRGGSGRGMDSGAHRR